MAGELRAVHGKWVWLAGRLLAVDGGVLNITAAACTASFHWWRSGNVTRTQNVSEYMLVLALCLVVYSIYFFVFLLIMLSSNKYQLSLTNPRNALHHGNRAANKGGRSVINVRPS